MGRTIFILVLLLTAVVGTIVVTINKEQVKLAQGLSDDEDMKNAKFIANTYAHNAIKDIRDKFIYGKTVNLIYSTEGDYKNAKNVLKIGNSTVRTILYKSELPNVKKLEANQEWGIMTIAKVNAAICTTRTIYKKMPFSEFGLFTNSFPNNVYFGDGELLDGPVYINGNIGIGTAMKLQKWTTKKEHWNIYNNGNHYGWYKLRKDGYEYPENAGPIFTDLVYVTGPIDKLYSYPKDFIYYFTGFRGGAPVFSYPVITMPSTEFNIDAGVIASALKLNNYNGKAYQYVFLNGEYIRLSQDEIEDADPNKDPYLKISTLQSNNFLLYNPNKNLEIFVKGNLEGRLTIATEGRLTAIGSIWYSTALANKAQYISNGISGIYKPLPDNDTSMLGLMANGDFLVKANTENRSTNDIMIMGNVYTKGELIITEGQKYSNYPWTLSNGKYIPRHFIVYGGRTQGKLQPGTFSGNNGLKEVISYDRRMKKMSPPCAPYTDKGARISFWEEKFAREKKKSTQ